MIYVEIVKAFPHSLFGKQVRVEPTSLGLRGEESYVA
jgi:hypothetical protein